MNEEELQWLKEISTTTGISYSGDRTISTDFANKIIDYIKELEQLQNNWNELKKGLKSLFEFDEGVVSKDYLECAEDTLNKMQELEGNNE